MIERGTFEYLRTSEQREMNDADLLYLQKKESVYYVVIQQGYSNFLSFDHFVDPLYVHARRDSHVNKAREHILYHWQKKLWTIKYCYSL